MIQNPLYRNILFSPKIWGLKFNSLLFCLLTMVLCFFLSSGLGLMGKFLAVGLVTGSTYGFWLWKDNRDEVAYQARKSCSWKRSVCSCTLTNRFVRFD